jgi:hypothetical protein
MLSRAVCGSSAQKPICRSPRSCCCSVVSSNMHCLFPLMRRMHFTSLLKLQHILRPSLDTFTYHPMCMKSGIYGKNFAKRKMKSLGWFWVVGLGDSLRGEKGERAKNMICLQTFPPNPFFLVFFVALRYLKCLECFEPSAVCCEHVEGHAWFTIFENLPEVSHCQ